MLGSRPTVIVPTLGRPVLARVLASLAAGTVRPATLILADQGDDAAEAALVPVREAGVEIVHLRFAPAGAAAARNRAIQRVETPFFAALDDDCVPAADWLERVVERLARHSEAIVTGRVEAPAGERGVPSTLVDPDERIHRRPSLRADPLHTGNYAVATRIARRVGPFDEALEAAEDNDWGHRALRLGVPIVYAPEIAVVHDDARDEIEREAVEWRYARGQGGFYGKHLGRLDPWIAARAARDLARGPIRWLRGSLAGDAALRASGRAWTAELPRGIVRGLLGRTRR